MLGMTRRSALTTPVPVITALVARGVPEVHYDTNSDNRTHLRTPASSPTRDTARSRGGTNGPPVQWERGASSAS
jgi:hypothetical protein